MMMYIIIGIACLVGIIVVVLLLPNSGRQQQKGQKYRFELSAGGGRKITFADPFDNFLVYGGANSGKTKSIGKPLLSQYIQAGFAGFVYNYKDFDLARTAVHLVKNIITLMGASKSVSRIWNGRTGQIRYVLPW